MTRRDERQNIHRAYVRRVGRRRGQQVSHVYDWIRRGDLFAVLLFDAY